jgi:hypothetical protein
MFRLIATAVWPAHASERRYQQFSVVDSSPPLLDLCSLTPWCRLIQNMPASSWRQHAPGHVRNACMLMESNALQTHPVALDVTLCARVTMSQPVGRGAGRSCPRLCTRKADAPRDRSPGSPTCWRVTASACALVCLAVGLGGAERHRHAGLRCPRVRAVRPCLRTAGPGHERLPCEAC